MLTVITMDQRKVWQDERERRGLVPGHSDFGRLGLMTRLDVPCALVTTLPADPLRPGLDFDDSGLGTFVLTQRFTGLTANCLSMLDRLSSTSASLVRYSDDRTPEGRWRSFVGLRRDGGVDVGIGSVARRTHGPDSALAGQSAYMLFVLVQAVRAAVETQTRLADRLKLDPSPPMEVDVALPGAEGAYLGGFADGWALPEHGLDEPRQCLEPDPLVRIEVDEWPDEDHQGELVHRLAQRICDSFGVREPRFLVNQGRPGAGRLLPAYA